MSGNRYLLDTNAIVALLAGDKDVSVLLKPATWVGISIISSIEFLAFPELTPADALVFKDFESMVNVCDLSHFNSSLIGRIASLRSSTRLKLPDCIVSATAVENNAVLVTRDTQLLSCTEIPALSW